VAACDIGMKELETEHSVDIPRLVLRLRQDRAGCVQTRDQYIHIYQVLHYYATKLHNSVMGNGNSGASSGSSSHVNSPVNSSSLTPQK